MSENKNIKNSSICVLLPVCIESDTDTTNVFLKILKSVVNHTRLEDVYVDSFKSGMSI